MEHADFCEGYHTSDMTCEEVTDLRAKVRANPWYCHGNTRSGYHGFDAEYPLPTDTCYNEGCNRTWGELQADLQSRPTEG